MKWTPASKESWRKSFALWPCRTQEGVWIWLEHLEKRKVYRWEPCPFVRGADWRVGQWQHRLLAT